MDKKTNDIRLIGILAELKAYRGSATLNLILQLIEFRADKYRLKNDTAPEQEFLKNQGAIQELLSLLKDLN